MLLSVTLNFLLTTISIVNCHVDPVLDRRGAKGVNAGGGVKVPGVPNPPPPPPVKPPRICGTSFCDSDMLTANANLGPYHVPNVNILLPVAWSSNTVNSGVMITTTGLGTSKVKYGGFCSGAQKSIYFLGSFVPAAIAAPSWIAKIPVGDLDGAGSFFPGLSYKIDVTGGDITAMNSAAAFCKTTCASTLGCKYGSYGWEAPAGWFCKLYGTNICTDTTQIFWKPAPLALPVLTVGGVPPLSIPGFGACRITDTIPTTTQFLLTGSSRISSLTAYTATLPYLTSPQPAGIVASIKCDVPAGGGLTPGWPTFGTVWL